MSGLARNAIALFVAVALSTVALPARAWVERTVKSDSVTLDVERDGSAVVTHDILLAVRGGPLPEIAVEPVDADAVVEEGATATLAASGHAAGLPLPLAATVENSRVTLKVVGIKGLRSGTHQLRFSYRTNLFSGGRLHPGPAGTLVEWSGPSFGDGIDSARVVFRLPSSAEAPRVGSALQGGDPSNVEDEQGGVFLSTFRRTAGKDELEVIRPHMAKNEIVSWRVTVDPSTFDVAAPRAEPPEVLPSAPAPSSSGPKPRPLYGVGAIVAGLLASLFGVVVAIKSRWVARLCRERAATARPLLPIHTALRALLAASGIFGAVALVVSSMPLLGAASAMVALLAATHLSPRCVAPLRGPGSWVRLEAAAAFDDERPKAKRPGRFLDAGHPLGFLLFLALLVGFVAAAITVMRGSEYYGLSLALASSVLFPLFCTGRAGELPLDPAHAPRELCDFLIGELGKEASLETAPLGRVPRGSATHDELRLLVAPKRPMHGFVSIEVGLDFHDGALGLLALPFALVRVVENSTAAESLPKGLFWTRGRNADERVAVLRPKVPTMRQTATLVRELALRLSTTAPPLRPQSAPTSATKASGSGASTAKAGTTSSPAHAT